jgi:hypothetical protein
MTWAVPLKGQTLLVAMVVSGLAVGCEDSGLPDDKVNQPQSHVVAKIVPASEALTGAHIPTLDPMTMAEAAVSKVIGGDGPRCEFRYTTAGAAALAMSTTADGDVHEGVVKVNGSLVALAPVSTDLAGRRPGSTMLAADPIRLTINADRGNEWKPLAGVSRHEATMIFEIGSDLKVGYRGYLDCSQEPVRISHRR